MPAENILTKPLVLTTDIEPIYASSVRAVLNNNFCVELDTKGDPDNRIFKEASVSLVIAGRLKNEMTKLNYVQGVRGLKLPVLSIIDSTESNGCLPQMLKLGLRGLLLRDADPNQLKIGVETAVKGEESYIDPRLMGQVVDLFNKSLRGENKASLSLREIEMIKMAARSMKNREIAERFGVGLKTINNYFSEIYSKLDILYPNRNRNSVREVIFIKYLIDHDLFPPGDMEMTA